MAAITEEMAELTIRSIGLILSNSNVYGPEHSVTRHATDACFQHLSRLCQSTASSSGRKNVSNDS